MVLCRTLEVYEKRGVTYSQLLSEQQGGADTGSPQRASLRFPKACVFWIRCDTDGRAIELKIYIGRFMSLFDCIRRLLHGMTLPVIRSYLKTNGNNCQS